MTESEKIDEFIEKLVELRPLLQEVTSSKGILDSYELREYLMKGITDIMLHTNDSLFPLVARKGYLKALLESKKLTMNYTTSLT